MPLSCTLEKGGKGKKREEKGRKRSRVCAKGSNGTQFNGVVPRSYSYSSPRAVDGRRCWVKWPDVYDTSVKECHGRTTCARVAMTVSFCGPGAGKDGRDGNCLSFSVGKWQPAEWQSGQLSKFESYFINSASEQQSIHNPPSTTSGQHHNTYQMR